MEIAGLKEIRKQRKYTQQKLAFELNISREALSYYENGRRSPDIEMLVKISDYFMVPIDLLIRGSEQYYALVWSIK